MGNIGAVARQTLAECWHRRVVLLLVVLNFLILAGTILVRGDNTLTGGVQAFLTYYLGGMTFVLSVTSLFLSKSLSDELVGRQVYLLMSKPLARWQFIAGKWLGVTLLNLGMLVLVGLSLAGACYGFARAKSPIEGDHERLMNEVFVARHAIAFEAPDYSEDVVRIYDQRKRDGVYAFEENHDERVAKAGIRQELDVRYRAIPPGEARVFMFKGLIGKFTEDRKIQLRFYLSSYGVPPDEVIRCVWRIGNPEQGAIQHVVPRRDVANRYHTVEVPADAVAPDGTLAAQFINANPFEGEPQFQNVIVFEPGSGLEVLFQAGTFAGNLARLLTMIWCRLMFLAAVGLLATSVFSFPVAALVCAAVYVLAGSKGFLDEAFTWYRDPGLPPVIDAAFVAIIKGIGLFVRGLYWVIPNFAKYQGLELFVTGRNVTLMWALQTLAFLGIVRTGIVLLLACLFFERRQVAELSV